MAGSDPSWLAAVVELLGSHLGSDGCLAFVVDEGEEQVRLAAAWPVPAAGLPALELGLGFGVVGKVAADQIPASLADDQPRNLVHRALLGLAPDQPVSRLCVPCLGSAGSVAVLAVHDRRRRSYSAADLRVAAEVAGLVGLRIERDAVLTDIATHRAAWEGLVAATVNAQEAERRRVAADLHDGVTQAVASLAFHLSAAETALTAGRSEFATDQVRAARVLADLAFEEARSAIAGLRSPVLEDLGLAAALESLARAAAELDVTVEAADVTLPEHVATALFRIAQEALWNCVKHSGATTVIVSLDRLPSAVSLTVSDDGRGFDMRGLAAAALTLEPPDSSASSDSSGGSGGSGSSGSSVAGYGLVGMYERAQLLGGRLVVESEPGAGTTVRVSIPL